MRPGNGPASCDAPGRRRSSRPRRTSCRRCPGRAEPAVADLAAERVDRPGRRSPSVTTSVWPSNISVGPGPPPPSTTATTLGRPGATSYDLRRPSPSARILAATSSAAGASLAAVAGSLTLGMRTSSWVKATTASSSTLRSTSDRVALVTIGPSRRGWRRPGRRRSRRPGPWPAWVRLRAAAACRGAGGSRRPRRWCPVSTIAPSCMTATRSQTCRTTDRSCETKTRVRPSSSTRSVIRLSTWARTDTSRALTGSSATRIAGAGRERAGDGDALALAAGELVRVAAGRLGRQADRLEQLGHPRPRGRACRCADQRFGDDVAHPHARVERAHRVLEDQLQPLAQEAAAVRSGQPGDVGAVDQRRSPLRWAGRGRRGSAAGWTCRSRTRRRCRTARRARRRSDTPRRAWTTGPGRRSEVRGRV